MAAILALLIFTAIFGSGIHAASLNAAQRISAGWEATPGQFTYQLSLRVVSPDGGVAACGGVIIHTDWGLSAAHCTANRAHLVIRAGATNLTLPEAIFETRTWHQAPGYSDALSTNTQTNDISLISFERSLTLSDRIRPIRIQRQEDRYRNYQELQLVASGWGQTYSGTSPENLNWVYLKGISNFQCLVTYNYDPLIVDSTLCTVGYHSALQATCNGDNGGPLTVIDEDGRSTLIGIASFMPADGCTSGNPAGFTRPGFYHTWLQEHSGVNFNWDYSDFHSSEEDSFESSGDDGWNENSMENFFMPA